MREFVWNQVELSIAQAPVLAKKGYGRSESRSEQHVVEPAVLRSEIEALPDLTEYLKFGSHPV